MRSPVIREFLRLMIIHSGENRVKLMSGCSIALAIPIPSVGHAQRGFSADVALP